MGARKWLPEQYLNLIGPDFLFVQLFVSVTLNVAEYYVPCENVITVRVQIDT